MRTDFNRRDGREVYRAGLLNQLGEHSHEGSNPSPFANGAVQQSGRCEVGLNRLLTRKGENTVGSIPTRSPNLIGLACGVNRGQPQGAEGVGAYSNLAKPARFLTVSCNARKRMRSDRLASGAKDHRPSCTEGSSQSGQRSPQATRR